jgi:hypothetical protein
MNPKQTYLALVRTQYPRLYYAALQRVFSPRSNLGGLGDDLTATITPDLVSSDDLSADVPDISSDVTDSINAAYNASQSASSTTQGGSTDYFSAIANAISSLAPTVVQTQAAENLLNINTQRAAQGLPPLTANGQIVTSSMLSPTSATLAQMEAALSGSGGSVLLIGGAVLLAVILLSGRRAA